MSFLFAAAMSFKSRTANAVPSAVACRGFDAHVTMQVRSNSAIAQRN